MIVAALAALALTASAPAPAPSPAYTAQVDARLHAAFGKLAPARPHPAPRQGRSVRIAR